MVIISERLILLNFLNLFKSLELNILFLSLSIYIKRFDMQRNKKITKCHFYLSWCLKYHGFFRLCNKYLLKSSVGYWRECRSPANIYFIYVLMENVVDAKKISSFLGVWHRQQIVTLTLLLVMYWKWNPWH